MATLLFGDPDKNPALTNNKKGKNQTLHGTDNDSINIIFGDVGFMFDSSRGGNDTLQGGNNSAGTLINALIGDAALMADFSRGGNDILQGGNNRGKTLINGLAGDSALMLDASNGGNDMLQGGHNLNGVLVNGLAGDTAVMLDSSNGGNDTLMGGNNSDGVLTNFLVGDALAMLNNAKGGNDTLQGGDNNGVGNTTNHLYGDARYISESVHAGNDRLISGSNATDHMYGDAKNLIPEDSNVLNDILDIIEMFTLTTNASSVSTDISIPINALENNSVYDFHQQQGNKIDFDAFSMNSFKNPSTIKNSLNKLYSSYENLTFHNIKSGGADTFIFNDYFGNDYIHDFRQSDGDKIEFKVTGVDSFDDLMINDNGSNTIIEVQGHGIVTLVGITGVDLSGDINFIV